MTTHAFRIGGLQYELYEGFEQQVRAFCEYVKPKFDEYHQLLTKNPIWMERLQGVGVLTAGDCKQFGVTGPLIRAAGVAWDLRKAQPYSGYEQYDFDVPTRPERQLRSLPGAHGRDARVRPHCRAGCLTDSGRRYSCPRA